MPHYTSPPQSDEETDQLSIYLVYAIDLAHGESDIKMPRTPYQVHVEDGEVATNTDLHLLPLNVEKGSERFSDKDGVFPPKVATYRSNLTALSQRRNLLFVAYDHQIYVWEPAGPRQVLGAKPTLILTPVMKHPNAGGFISRSSPHGINNILVDELGRDEILLLVTDSGNVCGYHVENIFSYIGSAILNGDKRPILNPRIDPFFCENVGLSAWGLAVHKYARLIAITANTGIITVFAFALVDESHHENSSHSEPLLDDFRNYGQNWLHVDDREQFEKFRQLIPTNKHRSRNVRLSYEGHFTNIPCVGFLNSDLDSDGMWMVSTDIDNRMFVWAIWDQLSPFKEFDFYSGEPLPDVLRREERGWSVLALDPRSFRIRHSYTEACGGQVHFRLSNPYILDVTHLAQDVPDISFVYNPFSAAVERNEEEPTLPGIFDIQSRIGSNVTPETWRLASSFAADQSGNSEDDSIGQQGSMDINSGPSQQHAQSHSMNEPVRSLMHSELSALPEVFRILLQSANGAVISRTTSDDSEENDGSGDEEEDSDGIDNAPSFDAYNEIREPFDAAESMDQYSNLYAVSKSASPYFPILHFSETDIRLLRSPFERHPTVIARGPLRQRVPEIIASLYGYDRFNMVKYIAESGIVIAATQKGRAAVISLSEVADGNIALRIDWMLPLASQELFAERPLTGLLGVAVGPIQGFEKQPDVCYVPRGVRSHRHFAFHYRSYDNDLTEMMQDGWESNSEIGSDGVDENERYSSSSSSFDEDDEKIGVPELTFAESHGTADYTSKPQEPWHGLSSSRHYRVLLTYADHTVMSYEFWYEWSDASFVSNFIDTEESYEESREYRLLL